MIYSLIFNLIFKNNLNLNQMNNLGTFTFSHKDNKDNKDNRDNRDYYGNNQQETIKEVFEGNETKKQNANTFPYEDSISNHNISNNENCIELDLNHEISNFEKNLSIYSIPSLSSTVLSNLMEKINKESLLYYYKSLQLVMINVSRII